MDAWILAAVASEVSAMCVGGRIQRVGQPFPEGIALEIHARRPGVRPDQRLLISAHPQRCFAHLLAPRAPNPPTPTAFCQLLRRYLEGARMDACTQPGLERALHIAVTGRDELGNERALRLIAELTGRLANVILVDVAGTVLDCLHRVSEERNRHRELLPGRPYVPPPAARLDPVLELRRADSARLRAEIAARLGPPLADGVAPAEAVAAVVFGLTPQLCAAVADWAAGAPDPPGGPPAPAAGLPDALAAQVAGIADSVYSLRYRPCLLWGPSRADRPEAPPLAAAWPLPGWRAEAVDSASVACLRADHAAADAARLREARAALEAALRSARRKLQRRLVKQEEEQREAGRADDLRTTGETLLAYGHMVARGAAQAELPDLADPSRRTLVVLDPALSPSANAQRMLRRYQKARRAQDQVAAQVAATRAELDYVAEAEWALGQAEGQGELAALREELAGQGVIAPARRRQPPSRKPVRGGQAGRAAVPASRRAEAPPLQFDAGDGWRILVGRNAGGNDALTMRIAQPDDVWLHARQMPGSHVVLKPPAGAPAAAGPPDDALLAAARCAAHYSAGRGAAHVAVDHTRRRHVWKPAGARPGFVLYERERTLSVAPDDLPPRA